MAFIMLPNLKYGHYQASSGFPRIKLFCTLNVIQTIVNNTQKAASADSHVLFRRFACLGNFAHLCWVSMWLDGIGYKLLKAAVLLLRTVCVGPLIRNRLKKMCSWHNLKVAPHCL